MTDITYQFDRNITPSFASKTIAARAAKAIKTVGGIQKFSSNIFDSKAGKSVSQSNTRVIQSRPTQNKKIPQMGVIGKGKGFKDMYKKRQSGSTKSGINFPVGRILSKMRKQRLSDRVSKVAGVYMAAVMEYMISEIVEAAGGLVRAGKKKFIFPRHIYLAIDGDDEMKKYIGNQVIIPTSGRKVIIILYAIYTHPFLTTKEKIPAKNFMVISNDLKDIHTYQTNGQQQAQQQNSESEEQEN